MEKEVSFVSVFLVLIAVFLAGLVSNGHISGAQILENNSSTPLDNAIQFLKDFGFFNVVLPFLLVFAMMFGILEKTMVFGSEKKGEDAPRKNLNSIVAFVVALLFVAATNLVNIIQEVLPQIVMVLVVILFLMMLLGTLIKSGDDKADIWHNNRIKGVVVAFILIAIALIFMNAFGVLIPVLGYTFNNLSGTLITSIILLIAIVGGIYFITKPGNSGGGKIK